MRPNISGLIVVGLLGVAVWAATPALVTPAWAADGDDPGKAIYAAKCQACHGAGGLGDGPAAKALPKPPKSMATAEFQAWATDEKLKASIGSGKPGSAMRGFPMDDAQMTALMAYIRTFAPKPPAP